MNHILKKVIQCVVCFFCVLGMISTTGKRIKAEGGSIYSDYGNRTCDYSGCKPANNWRKSTNLSGSGSYYLAYSENENDDITTSELAPIDASKVFLTNNDGDTPVDTTNVIYFSPNYIELNLDNLAVGEYTLKIENSSLMIAVEKSYGVLKDSDGNEYTLNQNYPFNLNVGTKYTLEKVYKQTVNGEIKYTISAVSDDKGNLNIANDVSYTIEPKAEYEDPWGNLEIKTNEGPSFWFSYQICKSAEVGTIQINDDNSFVITFEDEQSLDSIVQNSMLHLDFSNNDRTVSFVLKGGTKNDGNKTLTFDNRVLSCGGVYAPKGLYSVSLRQDNNTWKLKGTDKDGKVTLINDINKEVPEGISYSLTQKDGFKLTCIESEACTAYLDTLYDTNVNPQEVRNTRYWSSGIFGNRIIGYGQQLNVPNDPSKSQLFEKVVENDKTIALKVPYKSFISNSKTGFNWGIEYNLGLHVLGYTDFYFDDNLKMNYPFPDELPDGWTFDVEWDEENKTIKCITNHKELFEDADQFIFEGENSNHKPGSTNIALSENDKKNIKESNGLYYLTTDDKYAFNNYGGYTFTVKLFNYIYGTIQAKNTITITGIKEIKYYPDDFVVKIIGDGIVVKTKNTEFIEDAIEGNPSVMFRDTLFGNTSTEMYFTDNTKNKFKKVSDTQIKLDIKADELINLDNEGTGSIRKFNINDSYYLRLLLDHYVTNVGGDTTHFKLSFEPIILANTIGKTNTVEDLKELDGYATSLQNVKVVDKENNNTDVSIDGNVAGAITENYERGNENSDLNLLPESDSDKETITVKTDIESLEAGEADELASKAGGRSTISIDVSISKEYAKDSNKNTEVTELPYDSNLTFNLTETNENETYVVVREHKESDGKTSYTLLDVTENEDGKTGSISSNKFSKFALVKQNILEMVEAPKGSTNEGSKTSLKFKTMVKATNVYLDNELIDPNNYEAEDDGTVTLKPEYVSKLSVGKHTLKIITKEGMASSEFEISAKIKGDNNTSSSVETKGWDDGGPFTTDKCGNVFDRWNNKIYEANGCNVGGYNLVRTDTID